MKVEVKHNRKLRKQFVMTLAVFCGLMMALWLLYQNTIFSYIRQNAQETITSTENNILTTLDDEFSRMKLAATVIAGDVNVQKFLMEKDVPTYYEKAEVVSEIIRKAAYPHLSEDNILTITADGSFFQFIGSISNNAVQTIHDEITAGSINTYTVLELDGSPFFCISNPIYSRGHEASAPVGYVVALSNLTKARRILTKFDTLTGIDTAMIIDDKILLSSNPEMDGQNVVGLDDLYGSVTVMPVSGGNLYAATAITKDALHYGDRAFIMISAVSLLMLMVTITLLYRRLSTRMVSPMLQNAENMQIGLLTLQISAHFVVNTISCIKGLAENGENEKAARAAENLAVMLRNLHESDAEGNVFEQIENLNRYVEIMNIRFDDKYRYDIDVDDRLCKYQMLEQVLQPIVENALTHGLAMKTGDCLLTVTGELTAEGICFTVSDNGIGMECSDVAAHQEMLNNADEWSYDEHLLKGVALLNIQKRIRARYGERYGLTLQGAPKKGLTVTVHLPLIKDE